MMRRITHRLISKWMLLNMLEWFSFLRDDLGPVFGLWEEDPDATRPIVLRLFLLYPFTGIHAILDSIRYHYY